MITLTTPIPIAISLAGATASYNKLRVANVQFDLLGQAITAQLQLSVSSDASKPVIIGAVVINTVGTPQGTISFPTLGVTNTFAVATLVAAIQTILTNFQNSLENALISQGAIVGTQATGL